MAELEGPKSATTSRAWGQPHVGEMRDLFTGTRGPDIECSCGPTSEMSTETPRRGCQSQTPGHLLPSQEVPRPARVWRNPSLLSKWPVLVRRDLVFNNPCLGPSRFSISDWASRGPGEDLISLRAWFSWKMEACSSHLQDQTLSLNSKTPKEKRWSSQMAVPNSLQSQNARIWPKWWGRDSRGSL